MLQMIPGLEERLMGSSEEEISFIADMVCVHPYLLAAMNSSPSCAADKEGHVECTI